jgi:hypothetical protein
MDPLLYLSASQAARLWPSDGQQHQPAKVIRAILKGKPSRRRPGESIKLRGLHDGRRWLTTMQWVEEFLSAVSTDRGAHAPVPGLKARAQAARARLAAKGWSAGASRAAR